MLCSQCDGPDVEDHQTLILSVTRTHHPNKVNLSPLQERALLLTTAILPTLSGQAVVHTLSTRLILWPAFSVSKEIMLDIDQCMTSTTQMVN